MFEVKHIKNKGANFIEVTDSNSMAYAKIDLKLGGSLQELILDGKTIISSKNTMPYMESYASALLFPFANRIENGSYSFNGKVYQLQINETEKNNALHGLVYDKTFKVVHFSEGKNKAMVHVRYIEKGEPVGFPFKYILTASYIIQPKSMELIVEVKNTDDFSFPFTIGWHPYFVSKKLQESVLSLDCGQKIFVNDQKIPNHTEPFEYPNGLKIDDLELDDTFILDKNHICLTTPDYEMELQSTSDVNFIHLYIPPNRKSIAIEPQTGAANNFNDNRGLKTLHPKELFEIRWKLTAKEI